jgi:ferric-dicitrate binding protein FerR (iron transport regulator)
MTPDEKYNDELSNPELEHILSAMKGVKVPPSSRSKEEAWSMLMQSVVEQEHQAKVVKIVNAKVWLTVAASVVVLITVGWSYAWFSSIEKVAPKGFVVDVVLPDGSQVMMNADSKIKYPKFYNLVGRKIKIEGEAYFKVKSGGKFTVTDSQSRVVEVLGTEFNVKSRDKNFQVVCFEGIVNVITPTTEPVKLTKGLGVDFENNGLKVTHTTTDSIGAPTWTIGEFFFQNAKLSDVLYEIERQFNVTIIVEGFDASERLYTGFFRNNNLKEALDFVSLPMGFVYEITPDSSKVYIKN